METRFLISPVIQPCGLEHKWQKQSIFSLNETTPVHNNPLFTSRLPFSVKFPPHTHTLHHLEDLSPRKVNGQGVFTNSELSLKYVDVYGFDFDYTLVHYTSEMHRLIYELSRDRLVDKLNVSVCVCVLSMSHVTLVLQQHPYHAS